MGFVQIVEFRSSRIDEMRAVADEWEAKVGSDSLARRRVLCQDRDDPGRYLNLVFFDSYDEAMENSQLPVTQELSARMGELADGPPTFHNLDVIEDSG